MKELRSEITIDAPAHRVWEVLTNLGSFPDWNPFMQRASGEVAVGKKLVVRLKPLGGMGRNGGRKYHRFDLNAQAVPRSPGMSEGFRVAAFASRRYVDSKRILTVTEPSKTRPETFDTKNLPVRLNEFNDSRSGYVPLAQREARTFSGVDGGIMPLRPRRLLRRNPGVSSGQSSVSREQSVPSPTRREPGGLVSVGG